MVIQHSSLFKNSLLGKNSLEEFAVVDFRLLVSGDLQVALDPDLFALFLEQAPKAGVMDAITLDHGHWCGLVIPDPDGRIILGDMRDGRTLD